MTQTPNFTIQPETRALNITKDHEAEIRFLVSSRTHLRGEAHLIPVAVNGDRTPQVAAYFHDWLTLTSRREVDFDASGEAKPYTVRIRVPNDADPGDYLFRLKVVDVAEPDETVGESPEIAFRVVGPKPTLAMFVLAAVLAIVTLTVLAVGAVILVQNRTNLQLTIGPLSATVVQAGDLAEYSVDVENRRQSSVTGVRLRYTLPEGIMGGHATVGGAITRHCDKINRGRTILCDLGTLAASERRTIEFTLIPDPNGPPNVNESTTVLDGESGLWAQIRSLFTSDTTIVQLSLEGEMQNLFQLSGNEITARTESRALTVQRCLAIEVRQDNTLRERRLCPEQQVRVSIDPTISEAALNEIQPYTIRIWNEHSTQAVADLVVRYKLPERLRYVGNSRTPTLFPTAVERDDYQCTLEDYFTVACRFHRALPAATQAITQSIPIQEIVLQLASTSAGEIRNVVTADGILSSTMSITTTTGMTSTEIMTEPMATVESNVTTTNLNTALRFDGVDDWVELGYAPGLPDEFTVELWVHPFSSDNGQAFVGAHTEDGKNLFLVGYWPERDSDGEGLVVNILDDDQIMLAEKPTRPYHLAVTVKRDRNQPEKYGATLYLHDVESDEAVVPVYRTFTGQWATTDLTFRNWVLGQEWDQGSPNPRPSDFFKGTMSEVRIWSKALDEDQVACVRTNRIYVSRAGAVELSCLQPDENSTEAEVPELLGYWRLDIPAEDSSSRASANNTGDDYVADLVAVLDRNEAQQFGAQLRGGVGWGGIDPRFGTGLLFDGINDYVMGDANTGVISLTKQSNVVVVPSERPVEVLRAAQPLTATAITIAPAELSAVELPTTELPTTEPSTTEPSTTEPSPETNVTQLITSTSIATWLYVADGIPTERQWLVGFVGDSLSAESTQVSAALMIDENGQVVLIAQCGGQTAQVRDTKTVPINKWVHFAGVLTLDCNEITIYRDGATQGQLDDEPFSPLPWEGCPVNIYLGGLPSRTETRTVEETTTAGCLNSWAFKGKLDETRLWTRKQEASDIRRWRNRPGEFFDEIGYWPFDEQSGNKSQNHSDELYQLTIVGPKWIDTNFDLADQDAGP